MVGVLRGGLRGKLLPGAAGEGHSCGINTGPDTLEWWCFQVWMFLRLDLPAELQIYFSHT